MNKSSRIECQPYRWFCRPCRPRESGRQGPWDLHCHAGLENTDVSSVVAPVVCAEMVCCGGTGIGDGCDGSVAIGKRVGDDGAARDFLQRRGYQVVESNRRRSRCGRVGRLMSAWPHSDKGHECTICTIADVHRCAPVNGTVDVRLAQAALCRTPGCRIDFMLRLVEGSYDRDSRDWIDGALWEGHHGHKLRLRSMPPGMRRCKRLLAGLEPMGSKSTYDDDAPSCFNRLSPYRAHRRQ